MTANAPSLSSFTTSKGFDVLFLMEELYLQQREVENQLNVGAKVLSFKSGPVTFKDSLFPAHAALSLHRHLQSERTQKRVFSSQVQHTRPSRLRGTHSRSKVLRPGWHAIQKEKSVGGMARQASLKQRRV